MNTDSKPLKRYVSLLNKAPFILFIETRNFPIASEDIKRTLASVHLSMKNVERSVIVEADTVMQKILYFTNELPDTIAYHIVDAFAAALPHGNYFSVQKCFTSADWQKEVKWQNVDIKPKTDNHYTIAVEKFTHKLSIVDDVNTVIDESKIDGMIHLDNMDSSVPFPLHLLKDCVIEIHDIITSQGIGRDFSQITKSKYTSVMQTGRDTFNYINMKKVENDLRAVITGAGITIEE